MSTIPSRLFSQPKVFLTGAELASVMGKVSLFDVRSNLADHSYGKKEHIKKRPAGSFFVDLDGPAICDASVKQATGARHPLPPLQDFIAYAESAGMGRKPAVCFDDWSCGFAARLWWQLTNIGVEAYLIDGGVHTYYGMSDLPVDEGETTVLTRSVAEPYAPGTSPYFLANKGRDSWDRILPIEKIDEIVHSSSSSSSSSGLVITDARAPDRYGSLARPSFGPDPISGHIPTAINVPFPGSLTAMPNDPSCKLKPLPDLEARFKKIFQDHHVTDPSEQMVMSCGSGVTAIFNIAVMAHIGAVPSNPAQFPRLYVGSWSEYATRRRDGLVKEQIDKQGFSLVFEKKNNNLAGTPNAPVSVVQGGNAIVVDDVSYETAPKAIEALGKNDEAFGKALSHVYNQESAQLFTAVKTYKIEVQ